MNKTIKRIKKPTPSFFRLARNAGLAIAGTGMSLFAAPVTLSTTLSNLAGYLILAGGIISGISQSAIKTLKR